MSTVDRLRELVRTARSAPGPAPGRDYAAPRRELTYEPVDKSGLPLQTSRELPALEGAAFVDTAAGQALAIDRVIEADAWHGQVQVEGAQVHAADVALLSAASHHSLPLGRTLFLDLETTGPQAVPADFVLVAFAGDTLAVNVSANVLGTVLVGGSITIERVAADIIQ